MTVRIVPTGEEHLEGFHAALDTVARERRYLGLTAAFPLEPTRAFVRELLETGGVHLVAVAEDGKVVGWCDIARMRLEGFRHVGRLGMGLLREHRRQGIGSRLALTAIAAARQAGIERIELEVFGSNGDAIRLYQRLGFLQEGVKREARKIDGRSDDTVLMALLAEPRG